MVLIVANLGLITFFYFKTARKLPLILHLGGFAGYAWLTYSLTHAIAVLNYNDQVPAWEIYSIRTLPIIIPALVIGHFICLFLLFCKLRAAAKKWKTEHSSR